MTNFFSFLWTTLFCRQKTRLATRLAALTIFFGFCVGQGFAQGVAVDETPMTTPNVAQEQESGAPPIPEEFNEEARVVYEEQLKTLRAQMDAQKWEDALLTADDLIKVHPREPQVRFIRTIALTELARDDEAKNALLALISDFPELPEPRNNLAALYAKAGEFALAQRELEIAIDAVPDYSVAHANLADLYLQMALQHYQKAVDANKDATARRTLNMRLDNLRTLLTPKVAATENTKDAGQAAQKEISEETQDDAEKPQNSEANIPVRAE